MPVLHPAEIWQQSGRWDQIGARCSAQGPERARHVPRHDPRGGHRRLAAREIRSYRDLPQIWYQIQTKERDEARPRSGILRTREFLMKDSYTLDPDLAALERAHNAYEDAYCRIFARCGLAYVVGSPTPA